MRSGAKKQFAELTRRQRRRKLILTLIRAFLGATLLFVLYFTLPLDRGFDSDTEVALILGLLVVAGWIAFQINSIVHSPYPRLRAIGSLATTIPLFIIVFAATYYILDQQVAASFNAPLTRTDSLYFTITVFSTVGFGDIVPVTQAARIVAMVQMVGDLVLLGIIGKVVIGAVNVGLERSATARATTGEPADPPATGGHPGGVMPPAGS